MKIGPVGISLIAILAWAMFFAAAPTRAADDSAMKIGKKAEVNLDSETRAGDQTLLPGTYRVQHEVDGSSHFVRFTFPSGGRWIAGTGRPGEVECKIDLLPNKVEQTALYTTTENGVRRITRIEIAGENVAHLF